MVPRRNTFIGSLPKGVLGGACCFQPLKQLKWGKPCANIKSGRYFERICVSVTKYALCYILVTQSKKDFLRHYIKFYKERERERERERVRERERGSVYDDGVKLKNSLIKKRFTVSAIRRILKFSSVRNRRDRRRERNGMEQMVFFLLFSTIIAVKK